MSDRKTFVSFGEVMLRVTMPGYLRFRQALPGPTDMSFAGAEANVAAFLGLQGLPVEMVSALPENPISDACIANLNAAGVGARFVLRRKSGRLGIYFVEAGANQRPSNVIYDRDYSAIALTPPDAYDWEAIFKDCRWFHITGITPALSKNAAEAAELGVKMARDRGVTVSVDLNFRKKLWNWDDSYKPRELARKVMAKIIPHADIVIGNEEDADDMLNIKAGNSDAAGGKLETGKYPDVARQITEKYPNVSKVAFTLRESISASHNNWGAMLYNKKTDTPCFAPENKGVYTPYEIHNIVDRIGGGDSFSAGLIYALQDSELSKSDCDVVSFAVAASCLCHSIYGDFNFSTKDEILSLMKGSSSGRIVR
ncbi:PfkB domain protein [Treponema primitia ZAS-2]|uniref:PfkB domain protein n=1 Tax=Treponema primitia (strain ATCC BAA-887 / DSM 12427 / ZAS-2) TaxID=545694 RepID=F5YNJ1_TREPZ|nr:sugar kinase [Treponema primitia]AEF83621.1 PfkB domain protein [Treponema primitia ZAS-2]